MREMGQRVWGPVGWGTKERVGANGCGAVWGGDKGEGWGRRGGKGHGRHTTLTRVANAACERGARAVDRRVPHPRRVAGAGALLLGPAVGRGRRCAMDLPERHHTCACAPHALAFVPPEGGGRGGGLQGARGEVWGVESESWRASSHARLRAARARIRPA
eukprot:361704-Chlamydomonas_euryale.AAC.1